MLACLLGEGETEGRGERPGNGEAAAEMEGVPERVVSTEVRVEFVPERSEDILGMKEKEIEGTGDVKMKGRVDFRKLSTTCIE